MNSQATVIHPTLSKYAAFIGLDWSHGKHACALRCAGDANTEEFFLSSKLFKLRKWLAELKTRFEGADVAICVENHRGLLMRELERCKWVDIYAVNPATAAGYRRMFTPSGDKSDERDAVALLDLLMSHPHKLHVLCPRAKHARMLEELCRARRNAVDRRTGRIEALVELLRARHPLAMEMVGDALSKPIALAFLRRWPSTGELVKVRDKTLRSFFHKHGSRSEKRMRERLELLQEARSIEVSEETDVLLELRLTELLDSIETANKAVRAYDKAIGEAIRKDERAGLFESLPGAGEALAPRLLAAFRLVDPESAEQMQIQTGIAPIRLQTGSSLRTYMRRYCGKFLRQTLHEYAGCSIQFSSWAKAFYRYSTQVRKLKPQAAKRALAFKWIRILTACWESGEPYDERRYIETLCNKGVPYLNDLHDMEKSA